MRLHNQTSHHLGLWTIQNPEMSGKTANPHFYLHPAKVDINIKEKNPKLKQLKKEFLQLCKPFIIFLNIGSMTIANNQTTNHPEPPELKIYRIIIIIISAYHSLPISMSLSYSIKHGPNHGTTLSPLFYCDNILIILILITYWINYNHIQNIMNELIMKICDNDFIQSQKLFASIGRCSYFLLIAGIIDMTFLFTIVTLEALTWDDGKIDLTLRNFYFLAISNKYQKLIFTILQIIYYLSIFGIYIFFALLTVAAFMLLCCFKQLNAKLVSIDYIDLSQFQAIQNRHQQLANLVKRMSDSFSPALFLIILFKCIQIIFGVAVIQWEIYGNHGTIQFIHIVKIGAIYVNAVGIVATLTLLGGKLQIEVRNTVI